MAIHYKLFISSPLIKKRVIKISLKGQLNDIIMKFKLFVQIKRFVVAFISALISISAISQEINYRKDDRPQNIKEDRYNEYQTDLISVIDLYKALEEMAGIRIFKVPISPVFEKVYTIFVILDEYVDGEKTNSKDLFEHSFLKKNTYHYAVNDTIQQKEIYYDDFIPNLTFVSQDNDTIMRLSISHYGVSIRGTSLHKQKLRDGQFYNWRIYRKTEWKLNEEVPVLVFASSWHDGRFERFCGTVDLSEDEEATKELLEKSPHYFVISLKVSE